MMQLTSAQAVKLLKKMQDDLISMERMEEQLKTYHAAMGENAEDVRPEYDFEKYQKEIERVEAQIITLKHAINTFNISTVVPGFDRTIDQMLVFIPMLTKKKEKYLRMKDVLPKQRDEAALRRGMKLIDYIYANYEIEKAKDAYEAATDELAKAQNALDIINNTVTFEVIL